MAQRRTSNEPDCATANFEVHVNWKVNLIILGLAAAAFAGILGLESLASAIMAPRLGTRSQVRPP